MPLHSADFDEYLPFVNDAGKVIEDRGAHCRRVGRLLPNFPDDVLGQWIYEHWSDVGRFEWLDFQSLTFHAESWSTEQVTKCGAATHEFVRLHKKHFEAGQGGKRTDRIATYMRKYGTWPVPPLLVQNESKALAYPGGGSFCCPFHPIEGQHRLGVFMSLTTSGKLISHHAVWRVSVASAASQETPHE